MPCFEERFCCCSPKLAIYYFAGYRILMFILAMIGILGLLIGDPGRFGYVWTLFIPFLIWFLLALFYLYAVYNNEKYMMLFAIIVETITCVVVITASIIEVMMIFSKVDDRMDDVFRQRTLEGMSMTEREASRAFVNEYVFPYGIRVALFLNIVPSIIISTSVARAFWMQWNVMVGKPKYMPKEWD